jgi:ankyrin repeat protein
MLAIFLNNSKIIKSLLPFSDTNTKDNNGNTLFMIAASNGNVLVL